MSLSEKLKEHGIKLRNLTPGLRAIDCPKSFCQKERQGNHQDCLKLEILNEHQAKWKCSFCLWSDKVGEEPQQPHAPVEAALTWQDYLAGRHISPEQIIASKMKWDEEAQAIAIPHKQGNKVLAVTYTKLDGSGLYRSKAPQFYGVHATTPGAYLVIAQDELDCLTLRSAGVENVIAIPNGGMVSSDEEMPADYIAAAADVILAAERVIIATHNTPYGETLRTELIRRIGPAKCWNVNYTNKCPVDTINQIGVDGLCADINEATACPILGLYEVSDFERELLTYFDGGMASGVSTGWEHVDKYYTVVPGQLTLITGIPNNGKSEWLDALAMNLATQHGWKIAAYSPENGKEAHATKLIEKKVMMPADPNSPRRMSRDTYMSGASWVQQHFYFIAADSRTNAATIEWVLERGRDAVLRYGIKGLIVDPFNRLRRSKDAPDKVDEYVSYVLDLLLNFAEMHGVAVWLVAHPKTLEKDRKTGKYPVPSAYDISGGANFANMSDNIIVIHRSDDIADTTEVHTKKIRFKHTGQRSQIPPLLAYDIETGRFSEPEQSTARYSVKEMEIESIDPDSY